MLCVSQLRTVNGLTVSFSVDAGRCLVLSGPSGSGKSLILRAIADLDPSEGRVSLDMQARDATPAPDWRRTVRYVAAEPAFWAATLADEIGHPNDMLGLTPALLTAPVAQLSTGQRQRGALLRALADRPRVLLLDEPTSALDAQATQQVEARLAQARAAGAHLILVTHDAAQAARMADAHYQIGATT